MAPSTVDEKSSKARVAMIFAVLLLVAGLSASSFFYFEGTQALNTLKGVDINRALMKQFDDRGQGVVLAAAAGGSAFAVGMVAAAAWWRRAWRTRLKNRDEQWRKTVTGVQLLLAETRKAEAHLTKSHGELKEELASQTYKSAQLQTELDQLKKAEKSLSQQRQVLESSKTVLELHVQERASELQRLQRRYELILNSAGEGICGLDLEGKATFVNPATGRITGWPVSELVGKTEQEIFGPKAPEGKGLSAEGLNNGERMLQRKDGSAYPVEFVKTPLNENGKVVGAVVVFKDITERKRVESQIAQKASELARSNAELEQFAFVASHDLQEPLRKIQAFGDRLKTKCEGVIPAEAVDYLDRMQSASARMRTLINDLLAFSRVIRSSEPFVAVNLGQVTKEVLVDLEVRIEKTGAKVEVGELPTIEADPMQIRQLFQNLIGNALKFQAAGTQPVVKISSKTYSAVSGERLCEVIVSDNGIGFEEKYLEKMFAVFQRLHGRNEYEGTGVGLAVCRRIADRHHGSITAKGELGKGATFIITLPIRQAPAAKK
jgi:PAS domain S-box-containing protein